MRGTRVTRLLAAGALAGGLALAVPAAPAAASGPTPELGIQNCWVGGPLYYPMDGGEVGVEGCYDIQQDAQGYKIAAVVSVINYSGAPAPVDVTVRTTGGEDTSTLSTTVDVSGDRSWHDIHGPWNRSTGVYNGYGTFFGPGMPDGDGGDAQTPAEVLFLHNDSAWLP